MFLHFLSEYYAGGDPGIVLDVWNACVQTEFYNDPDFIEALKTVIPEYTNGVDTFDDMMTEYAAWRAITSGRDDGVHFADGGLWPPGAEVVMDTILDLAGTYPQTMTPVNPPYDYGFSYIHLINPASAPNGVMLEFSGDTGVDWAVVVIECRNNHALHVKHRLDINSGQGHMLLTPVMLGLADEFIVGVVNLSHDGFNTNLPGDERPYTVTLRKGVPDTALRLWTDSPMTGPGMEYVLNLEMEYYGQPAELDLWLFVEIESLFFSLFTSEESAPAPIAIPVRDGFTVTTPVLRFDMPQLDAGIHLRWHAALLSGDTVHDYCVIRSNLATMVR